MPEVSQSRISHKTTANFAEMTEWEMKFDMNHKCVFDSDVAIFYRPDVPGVYLRCRCGADSLYRPVTDKIEKDPR